LTKKKGFSRFNLVASGKRKYRGKQEDESWYLLTNLPDFPSAIAIYGQRYGIEAMFKDCKTGGYNRERVTFEMSINTRKPHHDCFTDHQYNRR
jgi:hypothetical protein